MDENGIGNAVPLFCDSSIGFSDLADPFLISCTKTTEIQVLLSGVYGGPSHGDQSMGIRSLPAHDGVVQC